MLGGRVLGPSEPSILGALVTPMRAKLREDGTWEQILRLVREDDAAKAAQLEPIDTWVPARAWVAFLDRWMAEVGRERVRLTGREMLLHELSVGRFASLQRSWIRAFGKSSGHLARLTPHLWRAAMRKNGTIRMLERGEGFVRLRLEDAPLVAGSRAWQAVLEGSGVGLFDHVGIEADVQLAPALLQPGSVDGLFSWNV